MRVKVPQLEISNIHFLWNLLLVAGLVIFVWIENSQEQHSYHNENNKLKFLQTISSIDVRSIAKTHQNVV